MADLFGMSVADLVTAPRGGIGGMKKPLRGGVSATVYSYTTRDSNPEPTDYGFELVRLGLVA